MKEDECRSLAGIIRKAVLHLADDLKDTRNARFFCLHHNLYHLSLALTSMTLTNDFSTQATSLRDTFTWRTSTLCG